MPAISSVIDTFHARCEIAKRGKNTQGRSNVRQVNSALFCHADGQVPLYDEVYEGNRHDAKQFPVMSRKFHEFLTDSFGGNLHAPQITLIFDKGQNSQDNFRVIDTLKLHDVGSIKLGEITELAETSPQDPRVTSGQTLG